MYDQIREDRLFIMFYAVVTAMAMLASCYLLLRRANAIAPDVTPPVRLRRWAAAFLAALALNHVWYMPIIFLSSNEDIKLCDLVGGLLDSMTLFPLAIVVLLTMLQDRRRALWPVAVMFAPLVAGGLFSVATRSYAFQPMAYVYSLFMCSGLIIYMVRALRHYGLWLRDNYADLEHKEVWQSFVVLAFVLLVFAVYALVGEGLVYQYAMQVVVLLLICYLLWRVETLSDLGIYNLTIYDLQFDSGDGALSAIQTDETIAADEAEEGTVATASLEDVEKTPLSLSIRNNIEPLLKQHCEEAQLYLQYDISISQLAQTIGINRLYLSQHFSSRGLTYNAYINGLRIQHFIHLYHEAIASHQPVTAQQLAFQSGFRSYNTFSVAFKKMMGMTTTDWMRSVAE